MILKAYLPMNKKVKILKINPNSCEDLFLGIVKNSEPHRLYSTFPFFSVFTDI